MTARKLAAKVGRVDGAASDAPATTLILLARFARRQRAAAHRWLRKANDLSLARHDNCRTCGTDRRRSL